MILQVATSKEAVEQSPELLPEHETLRSGQTQVHLAAFERDLTINSARARSTG